jgi:hypothetical protein
MQNPTGLSPRRASLKFFDLLVLALRHWPLLLLVPLVVGGATWGASHLLPRTYLSSAIVALPNARPEWPLKQTPLQAASMMVSPLVLDPVVQQLGLYPELDRDRARAQLFSRVRATVGKELLVRLEVEAATPEEARRVAEAILEAWLRSLLPSEREKADLQRRLEVATAGLDSTEKALSQLVVETPLAAGRREAGLSVAAIGELRDRYLNQMLAIHRELEGQREVIKLAPSLPTRAVKPRKLLLAANAAVASFFLLFAALALRHLLELGRADPQGAEKLHRLREALARGRRKEPGSGDA